MPKKGENIYKRKDGRWEGRYIKGYLADGKAKYAYVYGKTYFDVKQKLIDDRIAFAQGKDTARCKTKYRDILHEWLAMSRMRIKESTYSRYVHLSETHIEPYLGTLTLDCLTTQAVEHHISFLISEGRVDGNGGLAPKTTSDILTIIKGSIDYARCAGYKVNCYLDRLNIKKPQTDMRVLNLEGVIKMREHRGVAADKLNIEKALCEYLKKHHKGARKTISSKHLEVVFSVTGAEIRRAVNALRCACQPICSDTSGYYFGEISQEIMSTVSQLNGRVQKIAMARDGLISSIERLEDS